MPDFFRGSTSLYILNVAVGLYLYTNIVFHHFACAFTPPGSPSYCPDPGRILGEKVSMVDGRKIYQFSYQLNVAPYVYYRYCHTCKCIKPPRAHHCSVAGRCIYNMDHYCPWMMTCVGFFNYRYFVSFLVFLQMGCLYCLTLIFWNMDRIDPVERNFILLTSSLQSSILDISALSPTTYCFTLALAASISSGVLLLWHMYLCLTAQTTVDFYVNLRNRSDARSSGQVFKNPFDEGWRKNVRRIVGYVPWYKIIFPSLHKPPEPKYPFELTQRPDTSQLSQLDV
eukprot:gene875-626_t